MATVREALSFCPPPFRARPDACTETLAEQMLFVVSGKAEVSLDGQRIEATTGATVHVPKGVAHGIVNAGDVPVTILEVTSPPGFQDIFREMHRLSAPSSEDIARIGPKYDIVVHSDDA